MFTSESLEVQGICSGSRKTVLGQFGAFSVKNRNF